ncbi:MAG: 3-oxoacyl-ACP reductase, partial [Kocuria sp.]|nr:3-oxoacyl-ACP reductase [Kocuria sp.]
MKDSYAQIVNSSVGKKVAGALGLPQPVELRRYEPGQDLLNDRKVLVVGGQNADGLAETLLDWNLEVRRHPESRTRYGAIIADFTDAPTPADLQNGALAVGAALRSLGTCGRVIVLGRSTDHEDDESSPELVATQKAVEGFMRSLAHEMRKGST